MFRLLAENVKDYAIFVVDPHRHILSWSKGAERLLGLHRGGDRRQAVRLLLHPRGRAAGHAAEGTGAGPRHRPGRGRPLAHAEGRQPLLGQRGGDAAQGRGRHAPGLRQDHAGPHRDEAGRGSGPRAGAATATADRPRPGPHRPLDADRRYKFVNKPYAARFGLHPREVVGRPIRDVLGGPAYAAIERHIDAALAGRAGRVRGRTPLRRAGAAGHAVCLRPGVRRRRAGWRGSSRPSSTSPRRGGPRPHWR